MPTKKLQLHFLTPYAPSNLNRDDLGRPKTAIFGGTQRLRVSSQSLKRAWRTSSVFKNALDGHIGIRTKRFGDLVLGRLKQGLTEKEAREIADQLANVFGAVKGGTGGTEQLVHITPEERSRLETLATRLSNEKRKPTEEELESLLAHAKGAADVALFGRMLAAKPEFGVDAACQVAHAISIHRVAVEDDYFTAVDDLKGRDDDAGAGHVGNQEFASAVLYHYVCISRDLLVENLGGDEQLVGKCLRALGEACLTVAPNAKQASFAARSRAHFALVESTDGQPRSLAAAFLKAVESNDLLTDGIEALLTARTRLDAVYGEAPRSASFDAGKGEGTMKAVLDFLVEA